MSYPIYTSQQIRQLEQALFDSGIVSHELMFKAGKAAFSILQQQWPQAKKIVVLCGAGNSILYRAAQNSRCPKNDAADARRRCNY